MVDDLNPRSEVELKNAMDRLLINATENGVEFDENIFTFRHTDPEIHDWEVIISRVAKGINN